MSRVRFDGVSKQFALHRQRSGSFQDLFVNLLHPSRRPGRERLWALRDISFDVGPGEMIGIIGSNGGGKSTILKLISRIIEPTSGQLQVTGRVGALLELGAGFHPDLTGRENIYMNGSIHGLSRKEIGGRLDGIVSFAELERFIDVPVKHYSSGMTVRLGFSVAAHTSPDILLIDEVLAVGDASFQDKCLEKIADFRRGECTIFLVSHQLETVQQLCSRAIWLDQGRIQRMGETGAVVSSYLADVEERTEAGLQLRNRARSELPRDHGGLRINEVRMVDAGGRPRWTFHAGEPLTILISYDSPSRVEVPVFSLLIHRDDGLYVTAANTYNSQTNGSELPGIAGQGRVEVSIESLPLARGAYLLSVGAYEFPDHPRWSTPADFHDRAYRFRVESTQHFHGLVALDARWHLTQ